MRTGAHDPKNLRNPSVPLAEELLDACQGKLKALTLAPEMNGSEEFIKRLKEEKISIHLGHSGANPIDVPKFADWGVDAVTHMYDALPTYPPVGKLEVHHTCVLQHQHPNQQI